MANTIVKFIDAAYLKQHTTIEQNVDDNKLTPFILKSQDTHLQEILGSSFMEHLYNAYLNNTMTNDERNLVIDYIQRMVAEWAFYEAYPHITFKPANKAVVKQNSDNSNPIELDELKYMRNVIRDLAEFYSERLRKYLNYNSELFPEYYNINAPENLPRINRSYFSGIYTGRGCNNCDPSAQYKNEN